MTKNFTFTSDNSSEEGESFKILSIFKVLIQGLVNAHGNEGYEKFLSLFEQAKGRDVRVAMEARLYPFK